MKWGINLIRELAVTDFKLRYSSSILGYFWSLLNPLLIFGTLYLVFSIFVRFDVNYYQLYLLLGIIIWTFFSEATTNGMRAIVYKASLVKKVKFPRVLLVIASNVTAVLTLLLNLIVFAIFFAASGAKISWTLAVFPLYLVELILIVLGASFFLAALFVKFRDLLHLWQVALQIGFWITPIIYPISVIPQKFLFLTSINPMARIIMDSRNAMIYAALPTLRHQIFTFLFALVLLAVGYAVFKWLEPGFAEEL